MSADLEKVAASIEASKTRQNEWLYRHLSMTPEESVWQECLEMLGIEDAKDE